MVLVLDMGGREARHVNGIRSTPGRAQRSFALILWLPLEPSRAGPTGDPAISLLPLYLNILDLLMMVLTMMGLLAVGIPFCTFAINNISR